MDKYNSDEYFDKKYELNNVKKENDFFSSKKCENKNKNDFQNADEDIELKGWGDDLGDH